MCGEADDNDSFQILSVTDVALVQKTVTNGLTVTQVVTSQSSANEKTQSGSDLGEREGRGLWENTKRVTEARLAKGG